MPVQDPPKSLGHLRATLNAVLSCEWVVGECSATQAASSKWTEPLFIIHAFHSHCSFTLFTSHSEKPRSIAEHPGPLLIFLSYLLVAFTVVGAMGIYFLVTAPEQPIILFYSPSYFLND